MYDVIIKNGTIVDGSGKKAYRADLGIINGKIMALDDLSQAKAEEVIDAKGKYVSPGFIDLTNISDSYLTLFTIPTLDSLVRQGITTILGGNEGISLAPLATPATSKILKRIWISKRLPDIILAPSKSLNIIESVARWLELFGININWLTFKDYLKEIQKRGIACNFGSLVGYTSLRRGITKEERDLTSEEMKALVNLISYAQDEGAFGLSFSFGHLFKDWLKTNELIEAAKIIGRKKKTVTFHLRDEGDRIKEALEEAIEIGKKTEAEIHISHLKIKGKKNWHKANIVLADISRASKEIPIYFDIYPYLDTFSDLSDCLPLWITRGGRKKMIKRLKDSELRKKIVQDIEKQPIEYEKFTIVQSIYNKAYVGLSLGKIAEEKGYSVPEAIIEVLLGGKGQILCLNPCLSEENLENFIKSPLSTVSTSQAGFNLEYYRNLRYFKGGEQLVHPRCFGTFPRFLGKYVREKKLISWEEAVYKITALPAERFGIRKRGVIKRGYLADIVVFDPKIIIDRATYNNPFQYPRGIEYVLVNGEVVVRKSKHTGKLAGEVLRH